ncbi:hypothetical protein ACFDTO_35200 [Microbacteriaceae bacterium 4G12]
MYKIWSLVKVLLKSNYADVTGKKGRIVLYIFSFLALMFFGFSTVGFLALGMYEGLKQIGQQGVLLGMGLMIVSIWVFLTSITSILTVFYYEDDIENLLPLPLQPSQIVTAKFITVLLTQYVLSSFVLIPILVIYGIRSGAFITYYLYSFFIYLLFPIIPLVIISLLMTIVMRFTNISRNKDRSRLIVGLISILFVLGINMFIQWNNRRNISGSMVDWLSSDQSTLLVTITKYFPTTYFASLSLLQSEALTGLLYLLLFAAISFAFYAIFFYVAQKYYLKGVLDASGSTAKKKGISKEEFEKTTMQQSKWWAYFYKELRLLFRTPVFFLNCIVQSLITPLIFFFAIFMQNGSVDWIQTYANNPQKMGLVLGLAFCAGMFLISSNIIATTAFSRDGQSWFMNQFLPVKASTIVFTKAFVAWFINALVLLLFAVAMIVLGKMSLLFTILWIILCLNGLWLNSLFGVRIDAQSADVHWDNEQKLFKGRYTPLWSFFLNVVLLAVTAGVIFVLYQYLHVGLWGMFFALLIVYGLINFVFHRNMELSAERLLQKIK